jgi:putative flavoprotein involved in K+ transport
VWATGYRSDYHWLHMSGVIDEGRVRHEAGVIDVPCLYFLGLPWQTCRGSALLGFVGADAATLAARMAADARSASATDAWAVSATSCF